MKGPPAAFLGLVTPYRQFVDGDFGGYEGDELRVVLREFDSTSRDVCTDDDAVLAEFGRQYPDAEPTPEDRGERPAVDLITRDENIRWVFQTGIDAARVDALAGVLAESMAIPDAERDELRRRHHASVEAGGRSEATGTTSARPTGAEASTRGAE
ncbi:hypothetical protein OG468_34010 [Streptomyces zaomyceticus]|uniref:hypothetical protein n=1 Tax=Streptomyces zaomyceticus TaxID=68286 RepID=UPI003250840E